MPDRVRALRAVPPKRAGFPLVALLWRASGALATKEAGCSNRLARAIVVARVFGVRVRTSPPKSQRLKRSRKNVLSGRQGLKPLMKWQTIMLCLKARPTKLGRFSAACEAALIPRCLCRGYPSFVRKKSHDPQTFSRCHTDSVPGCCD